MQRNGLELDALNGRRFERRSPVTGVPAFWSVPTGGCTHLISSRSFSANRENWVDQDNLMVGKLSGDSGCSPTNIPAGGLVNISNAAMPRFNNRAQSTTRTLAHRQPVTAWAGDACLKLEAAPAPVQVLGLPAWVGAWGQIGPAPIQVPVIFPDGRVAVDGLRYRLRFVVAEPDTEVQVGQRVFSIRCDDAVVADQVDPVALAKAPRTAAVVQAEVTPNGPTITVTLQAKAGSRPPVIGGILIERLP